MSVTVITLPGMSAAVIMSHYDRLHGTLGAGQPRQARAGSPRSLRRARVREHDRCRDRRAGRTDGANVLPALRRQARGSLRGRGRTAGAPRERRRRCASTPPRPIDAVAAALEAAGTLLQERRDFARQRQAVIAANAELRERELIKLASLAAALADALRHRGVKDPAASLTAEAGIAVFKSPSNGGSRKPTSETCRGSSESRSTS